MSKITVYSTPTCHFCHMAKDFFKEHNLPFEDINVAEDLGKRQEMIQMSGQMGVPVIVIDEDLIVGFNKPKILDLLKIVE